MKSPPKFTKDLSTPDPIPQAGIDRALTLLQNGRLHRYGEAQGDELEVVALEREYAAFMGQRYCVGLNSCGCGLFIALKCVGVKPFDKVLTNAFTLAPVPGAIAHCNAEPILVEVNQNYVIDLDDLRLKAIQSGAKVLLLSHMRGHLADMEALVEICTELGIVIVEDCAHAMGATWNGQLIGTFGAVGVFSTQTFKQINSGEGGLLTTDDEDIAAQAILYSGSYMLYRQHGARPDEAVFARWKGTIPNFSMRMTNLAAALLRPQLKLLAEREAGWNERYAKLALRLAKLPGIRLPHRPVPEGFIANSIQFSLPTLTSIQMEQFLAKCHTQGVFLKWFGHQEAVGFTSTHRHWEYMQNEQALPQTDQILHHLFDMRIPLNLTDAEIEQIEAIVKQALTQVTKR